MGDEFYKSGRWLRKRAKILRRDKYLCQNCLRYGRKTPAEIVHHIKPFDLYPELALNDKNLVSLCAACHNKAHPERAARKKFR